MAKPYRLNEAQILAKLESVPGTAENLASGDMFIAQDFKLTPSFGNTMNAGLTGTRDKEPGVSGVQTGSMSFKVALKKHQNAGTAPEFRDALMACGLSETISGGVSVTYALAAPESYYTFGCIYPGLGGAGEDILFRLTGCQGNLKLTWKAGELMWGEFTVQGVWVAPSDSSLLTSPTWDTSAPGAFLAPTMTFHGTSLAFETFSMDMGNELAIRPNANTSSGALTAQIVNTRVNGTVDPEVEKLATFNMFTKVGSNTTGAISMTAISGVDVDLPKVRFYEPDLGDRAGVLTMPTKFEALRSANAGLDSFSLIFT